MTPAPSDRINVWGQCARCGFTREAHALANRPNYCCMEFVVWVTPAALDAITAPAAAAEAAGLRPHARPCECNDCASYDMTLRWPTPAPATCETCGGTGTVEKQIGGDGYGGRCSALADVEVAMIAKIPLRLARYIAATYRPDSTSLHCGASGLSTRSCDEPYRDPETRCGSVAGVRSDRDSN